MKIKEYCIKTQQLGLTFLLVLLFTAPTLTKAQSTQSYEDLLIHRSGFAETVTGGAGGVIKVINNLNPQTLRQAVTGNTPKWIRFKKNLSGRIDGLSMSIGSNTTIDGRGANIILDTYGINILNQKNIIIHNITLTNTLPFKRGIGEGRGYGINIQGNSDLIWIDHCTFHDIEDEAISMGSSPSGHRVTLSYNKHFDSTPETVATGTRANLLGWGKDQGHSIKLTAHHNYYNQVARIPLLRQGKAHYFNNVIEEWRWSAVEVSDNGEGMIENNWFSGHRNRPLRTYNSKSNVEGWLCAKENVFTESIKEIKGGSASHFNCKQVFSPSKFYTYTSLPISLSLVNCIKSHAGRAQSPQWCPNSNIGAAINAIHLFLLQ